jgi:hypothetical protein
MTKRSKSLEVVNDSLIGVQPYDKRDFFNGCNEPGKPWFQRDAHEFIKIYCKICRNRQCIRALGAKTPWQTRMEEQVEYLINNPIYSDFTSVEHQSIAKVAWESLKQKAERLEIAARRQDWEVPEGPTDGFPRVAQKEVTDNFDEAVKALAKAQGKKEPALPNSDGVEGPMHFSSEAVEVEEGKEEEKDSTPTTPEVRVEYQTQYPSSDGRTKYRVALEEGRWVCACQGFKTVAMCKHIATVRSWYEEQVRIAEEQSQALPENPSPALPPPTPSNRGFNTPIPEGGVLLGGGPPSPPPSYIPQPTSPPLARDPWAPTNDRVVKPGAQVVIGNKKKG